jgi:hypothetical protein
MFKGLLNNRLHNVLFRENLELAECGYCGSGEVDDEFHLLNICIFLQDLRNMYLPFIRQTLQSFLNTMLSTRHEVL